VSTSFPGLREGHGKQVERYSGIISNPHFAGDGAFYAAKNDLGT